MLASKLTATNEAFAATWASISAGGYDVQRTERLVETAVAEVARYRDRYLRVGYGWSGGKDSLALEVVCERAGVTRGCCVVTPLEFPAMKRWLSAALPAGVELVNLWDGSGRRSVFDFAWLAAHPAYLFPDTNAPWQRVTWAGQKRFYHQRGLDLIVYGRRTKDGNQCGKDGFSIRKGDGLTQLNPIRDWSHEDVLAVCAHYGKDLPPCYDWPEGWRCGTGPWPGRAAYGSVDAAWDATRAIDSGVVTLAADHGVPGAKECLKRA